MDRTKEEIVLALIIVPIFLFFSFCYGLNDLVKYRSISEPNASIYYADNTYSDVVLIKQFQKGVFLRDLKDDLYYFFSWNNIHKITVHERDSKGILCGFLGIGCKVRENLSKFYE